MDISLLTSIIINFIALGIIIIVDSIDIYDKSIEKYRRDIGLGLFGLFLFSLFILLKEIRDNIIHFNTSKSFNIITIISIFVSNIFTFTLCYYSLYLINPDNFYVEEIDFNGFVEKSEKNRVLNIYSYINTLYFTFFTNFAATIRELDYKSLISKFFGVLQLIISVTISIFFIDKIVDLDISEIKKEKKMSRK